MTKKFNKHTEKHKRKKLRNNLTEEELILWSVLKNKALGHKFIRQFSIDAFVVDFYCRKPKLAIEIDGEIHNQEGAQEYDKQRQMIIEEYNVNFIRFSNHDIKNNLNNCIRKIKSFLPLPREGGTNKMSDGRVKD